MLCWRRHASVGQVEEKTERQKTEKEDTNFENRESQERRTAKTREESDRGNNSTETKIQGERCADCINKMRRLIIIVGKRSPAQKCEMQMAAQTGLRLAAVVGCWSLPQTK